MNSPEDHQALVFCAALQGYLASSSRYSDPDPEKAVEFARRIVREAYNNDANRTLPDYTGPLPVDVR